MALTKAEIAEKLYEELGLNKREAKEFVEIFFNEISETLVTGLDVKISGFGNFILRDKKGRPGRNPKTGEKVHTPEKKTIHFKMAKDLFKKLNNEK